MIKLVGFKIARMRTKNGNIHFAVWYGNDDFWEFIRSHPLRRPTVKRHKTERVFRELGRYYGEAMKQYLATFGSQK